MNTFTTERLRSSGSRAMRRHGLLLLGTAFVMLSVAGCHRDATQTPPPPAAAPATGDAPVADAPSVTNTDVREVTYTCADGRQIQARYDNSDPQRPGATLVIDGQTFEMHNVIAASGARYATETGFKPDHGLQWWTKGEEATLSEMIMDHTAPGPTELTTCRVVPPS